MAFLGRTTSTIALVLVSIIGVLWAYLWWLLLYSKIWGKNKWKIPTGTAAAKALHTGKTMYVNPADQDEFMLVDPLLVNPVIAGLILVVGPALVITSAYLGYRVAHEYKQMAAINGATNILSKVL